MWLLGMWDGEEGDEKKPVLMVGTWDLCHVSCMLAPPLLGSSQEAIEATQQQPGAALGWTSKAIPKSWPVHEPQMLWEWADTQLSAWV